MISYFIAVLGCIVMYLFYNWCEKERIYEKHYIVGMIVIMLVTTVLMFSFFLWG